LNYIDNWEETKQRFMAWWDRSGMDRPLMKVTARKDGYQCRFTRNPVFYPVYTSGYKSPEDYFLNVEKNVEQYRNYFRSHKLYAESFPNFDVNLGAGSLALYLGCEPEFAEYTIWFKECIKDNWNEVMPLKFNPENKWWKKHLEMIDKALELINGEFPVGIPDIVENVDILSAMRGPQKFCYDLIDEPDLMFELLRQLDDLYFRYYDDIYERVALTAPVTTPEPTIPELKSAIVKAKAFTIASALASTQIPMPDGDGTVITKNTFLGIHYSI
jgi:hypothetical protein